MYNFTLFIWFVSDYLFVGNNLYIYIQFFCPKLRNFINAPTSYIMSDEMNETKIFPDLGNELSRKKIYITTSTTNLVPYMAYKSRSNGYIMFGLGYFTPWSRQSTERGTGTPHESSWYIYSIPPVFRQLICRHVKHLKKYRKQYTNPMVFISKVLGVYTLGL